MAKRQLPAKTPSSRPAQQRGLRRGNPGNQGGTGRPSNAWRLRLRTVLEEAGSSEVIKRIISGDIYEPLMATKQGEIVYGPTKNRDRLAAIELASRIGYGLPAAGGSVEEDDAVTYVIFAPPKAKNAEEWLLLHARGQA